ncbi:MAG: hypothetical protein C4530_03420 [Desulfobacteraceae bacterium]|nr:MAG: hypothetical protein C4530_03420 [Desulfobacteraceae bacterium]
MDRTSCRFERLSNLSIGMVLLAICFGFLVIGVTLLPVFGIIFAIPFLSASFLFFMARRSPECFIRM